MQRIGFQDVMQTSTTPLAVLGSRTGSPDGREWVYVKLNEAASLGHIVVPVADTGVDTVSSSADADGDIVYVTEASAGWTAGDYADAWLVVDDGTGEGQVAKIKTNTADTLVLYKEWALTTALAVADSDITISRAISLSEKAAVTEKNQNARGAAQVAFSEDDYGWVLAKGPGVVIAGEVIAEGKSFTTGDDTEGEVVVGVTAEGEWDEQTLGYSLSANTTADKGFLGDMKL